MRTPLNGILGLTTLLKESVKDDKAYQDLTQLEMSGQYLLNLINDTLDMSKIEAGKLELHPVVCDGRDTLNSIISLIRPNVEEKKIHLSINAENLPFNILYIDLGRLEQIFMNILGNAVKFTPEGGIIDVNVTNISNENGIIRDKIVIRDNGIGMSKEFLPHLFESFSQENPGSTGNTQETGLGMAITKQFVEMMGGSIAVESEQGKGTTFTIEMPMLVATEEQINNWRKNRNRHMDEGELSGKRILLCEDHPLNANITIRLSNKKGVIVEHALDGKTGLEMFQRSDLFYYDLILMDIRMPIMDGLEATRRIRGCDRVDASRIPIVAMTANAFDEDIEKTEEAGMNAHLGKPVEVGALYGCIMEMLNLKRVYIRRKILIVDDIEMNRAIIKEALSSEFTIFEAENGEEALKILEEQRGVNILITDIQMPVMDGITLIKKVREIEAYNRIVIIANTQFGDPEQEEVLDIGADDFVYKPTTPKIIELRVRNAMNKI